MRILAALPCYVPEGGGLARYAHELLWRLSQRGHHVEALACTEGESSSEVRSGVHVRRFPARLRLGHAPVDPAFAIQVRRAHASLRPDVVVAHTPVPGPAEFAYFATRRWRTPFVTTYHAGRLRSDSPWLSRLAAVHRATLERRMLEGSARLVAVSSYVRRHALGRHESQTRMVPPGVDGRRFRPGREPDRPNVLFVGPLSRQYRWKGIDTLWTAFAKVYADLPDVCLTLVGAGDREAEFRQRAKRFDGAVRVLGRVDESALVRCYQECTVLALPSRNDAEAFGMVLLEANACGRPVVASRVGGIPDVVRDDVNGLLAPPGDAGALAESLIRILADPRMARRLGTQGREMALADHDWDRLAQRTERVFEEALAVAG